MSMCDCNQGRLPCTCKNKSVPPAGDVEVLARFDALTFNERRLYNDDESEGYLEGDGDFYNNNLRTAVWFLENGSQLRAHVTRLNNLARQLLDDSQEDAQTGKITVCKMRYERLAKALAGDE